MTKEITYTTEQSYTPDTVTSNPAKLRRVPDTNIDIQPENDTWNASVEGIDGSGNVVQLVPTGGVPVVGLEVTGVISDLESAFDAAAVSGGGSLIEELDAAIIAKAKTMLPK